jgi:hypothetical protein
MTNRPCPSDAILEPGTIVAERDYRKGHRRLCGVVERQVGNGVYLVDFAMVGFTVRPAPGDRMALRNRWRCRADQLVLCDDFPHAHAPKTETPSHRHGRHSQRLRDRLEHIRRAPVLKREVAKA